jgi:hypothetical protein
MTIEHVAGAVSLRVGIGQGEALGLGAQLEHGLSIVAPFVYGFLKITGGVLLSPLAEASTCWWKVGASGAW